MYPQNPYQPRYQNQARPQQYQPVATAPITNPETPQKTEKNISPITLALGFTTALFLGLTILFAIMSFSKEQPTSSNEAVTAEPTEISSVITTENLGFYTNKISNPSEDTTYQLYVDRNSAVGAYISEDNTSVQLYIYWENARDAYGIETDRTDRELFSISYSQRVAEVYMSSFGHDATGDILFIMLQDGIVEYIPIRTALQNNSIKSYGKVAGLENIVKFYTIQANDSSNFGYTTTFAQRADGTLYDLRTLIKDTSQDNGDSSSTEVTEQPVETPENPEDQPQE